ncbi:MAG: tetratricopeptide repeat protein, partial [Bacteroidaceae bacterium]|nr:tetratricopeptide repeat protein [Bacteroidaceae bacterium]
MLFITVSARSQSYSELVTAGTQQLEDGNYDAAIANYAKALAADSLSSINEMIYANMAQAYMGKGEKKRVEELYGKALEKFPRSKMLYALRAKFYLEQDKNEKALDDCNKVLSMDADNEDALYLRAYILTEKKKYDPAREDYYALLAANPDNRKAQFALALLYAKEHKDNQALLLLDNLIEKTPDVPEYYLACSNIEKDNARYELALVYLDE